VTLTYAVNTMISPEINYVQHHGFEKSDSIPSGIDYHVHRNQYFV